MPPTFKLAKTLWGVENVEPDNFDAIFARIKSEGFEAVEAIPIAYRKPGFCAALEKAGLALICQIHTTGGDMVGDEYQYCTSNKLHDHLGSFVRLTSECAGLPLKPILINSHSGHDSWGSGEKAVAFLKQALKVEAAIGVPIVHETHRQRLFYNPYSTVELLQKEELKALKLNADLSHWCVVCEHVFDAKLARDDFWPEALSLVARHCHFVHMRVGYEEGPQVNEPDAPEHAAAVEHHFSWWRQIWIAQLERNASAEGKIDGAVVWAEPEFGPPPYLHVTPYKQEPVADLWDVNKRIAAKARGQFAKALEEREAAKNAPPPAPEMPEHTIFRHQKEQAARVEAAKATVTEGSSMLDLATKNAAKEAKEAANAKKALEKLKKAVIKEGGKKGVEIEGASDMGGLEFFCTTIESCDGDVELLELAMTSMNAQPEPDAEDRKGCSGHVGKMIFSAGVEQLAILAYVPSDKAAKIDVAEWTQEVLGSVGGTVMMRPPAPANSPDGGATVQAVIKSDPEKGKYALKDKDLAMAAAFHFLRSKGAFPEDAGDDSDEMVFGDDDNLDDYA